MRCANKARKQPSQKHPYKSPVGGSVGSSFFCASTHAGLKLWENIETN